MVEIILILKLNHMLAKNPARLALRLFEDVMREKRGDDDKMGQGGARLVACTRIEKMKSWRGNPTMMVSRRYIDAGTPINRKRAACFFALMKMVPQHALGF